MDNNSILERLDAFFSEGANTDAIGNFLNEEQSVMQSFDFSNDSREALELYSTFKRYAAVVDSILYAFIQKEAKNGFILTLEQLATAVMEEMENENDYCRYLCTSYIAGALDFEAFKQLVADVNDMTTYPVGDEIVTTDSQTDVSNEEEI